MLTIRLKRVGRKHQPSFKVIVTPKNLGGPEGKPVEYLGWYNSLLKKFELKKERIQYWLSQGAKPSATLHNLLVKDGVIQGTKIKVQKKSKKPQEAPASPSASQAAPTQPETSAPTEQKTE